MAAALAMPVATDPHLTTFAPEGPWRGETHRLCDRPGSLARLLEEVAAAGAEQVILVTAHAAGRAAPTSSSAEPRRSARPRRRAARPPSKPPRCATRSSSSTGRFAGLFVIRPAHNPLGPLDFGGVYDERSDRTPHARRARSIAATRTPTASSSSRSSAPAASGSPQSNTELELALAAGTLASWKLAALKRTRCALQLRLIHVSAGNSDGAEPLTTPIYETTTFVFENAAEVRDYNEGQVAEVPLLALRESDGAARSRRRSRRSKGPRPRWCSRAARRRRRPRCWRCCRRATRSSAARRSTAARCTCSRDLLAEVRDPAAVRVARRAAPARVDPVATRRSWCGSSRRSTRRCAASTSRRSRAACRARGVHLGHRQHVRQPDQPAAARARRRPRDAQRDEVPERPQRRDRRRARRAGAR